MFRSMPLLCVAVFQFTLVSTESFSADVSANAGFITRISQSALDLLSDHLIEKINKIMENGQFTFNVLENHSNIHFQLMSTLIHHFDASSFKSKIVPVTGDGIVWTVPRGQIHLSYAETNATNTLSDTYKEINHSIRGRIGEILCSNFVRELGRLVSNRFLNTPLTNAFFDYYFINYGLVEPVEYANSSVMLRHRGNVFGIIRKGLDRFNHFQLPYKPPEIQIDVVNRGMVDFYLSNYTIVSLLYWMDQYRMFDYEISVESMNSSLLSGYLRTQCDKTDICAGTLFPALASRFPHSTVRIKTRMIRFPEFLIMENQVVISMESRVEAYTEQDSGSEQIVTSHMLIELTLEKPTFLNYTLNFNLRVQRFRIYDVTSIVKGIDTTSLEFLVTALNELIVNDDIARKLRDGLSFPIVFDFPQKSSNVEFRDGLIHISVNFCLNSPCNSSTFDEENYYSDVS